MSARKKYRPYGVNPTAHLMAMMGAAAMSKADVIQRASNLRDAVEAASRGQADKAAWRLVFDCINVVEQLARMKVVQGLDVIEELQATVAGVMDRQRETGTRALRASELAALRNFAADYTAILSGVTQQQYMQAQKGVEDRIRRILSGERIPASLRVVEAVE